MTLEDAPRKRLVPRFLTKRGRVVTPVSMAEARRLEFLGLEQVDEDQSEDESDGS